MKNIIDKRNTPTLLFAIFILLILISAVIYTVRYKDNLTSTSLRQKANPTYMKILPEINKPDANGDIEVYITLENEYNPVSSVAYKLFYDPKSIKLMDIQPVGVFKNSIVVKKIINDQGGRCCFRTGSIYLELSRDGKVIPGSGNNIVVLKFKAIKNRQRPSYLRFLEAKINGNDIYNSVNKYTSKIIFDN